MESLQVPKLIDYKTILIKKSFSPNDYKAFFIKNKNIKKVSELILGKIKKGEEVGSFAYLHKSNVFFVRAKALNEDRFLPDFEDAECAVPILPHTFVEFDLRKGDILLSKDSNIGEVAILSTDAPNFMLSGALFRLRFNPKFIYYIFSFLKTSFFKNQINAMTSKGATIKHAGTTWLNAVIPFPNQKNYDDVIIFISLLIKAIIRKEAEIKNKYNKIIEMIDQELKENQLPTKFNYSYPSINELLKMNKRIDAGLFCSDYKKTQFIISNYKNGSIKISDSEFNYKRGQNLQISGIGKSIYSTQLKLNFYKLIRPLNLSDYGTITKYEYLGNKNELQTLENGEIILSGEGTVGKFTIILNQEEKLITNIHGITFYSKNKVNLFENIFLGLFFGYLRHVGILDHVSVGGQGGSLSGSWDNYINIPNFDVKLKKELAALYYSKFEYDDKNLNLSGFENEDLKITDKEGIYQLDSKIKLLKMKINYLINLIINDEEINISFDFLSRLN